VPNPTNPAARSTISDQRGQSLIEFAISSVVLLLLVGGLADIGTAIYVQETLSNAVREGARHGVWFDAAHLSHPYLGDTAIQAAVDQNLTAGSLPASVLKPGCPAATDGNAFHNPPYASGAYPGNVNEPWLYICYNITAGPPGQAGLNVIVLYRYSPLTPALRGQFGTFQLASNQYMTVQGQ
jgi:hypothetical protein